MTRILGHCSPGTCVQCPNQDVQVGFKQFKSTFGNASTLCEKCSICGGPNQNGSQYDLVPCSVLSDAICRPCKSCPVGTGVLVGCASIFEGYCVLISPNVTAIKATAVSVWNLDVFSGQLNFVTSVPVTISFLGDFDRVKLLIPANANVNFTKSFQNLSLSIIVPPNYMTESASGSGLAILSEIIFCSPEGTVFSPFANLTMPLLERMQTQRILYNLAPNTSNVTSSMPMIDTSRIRLCWWNSETLLWEVQSALAIDNSNRSFTVQISRFSTYALCTTVVGGSLPQNERGFNYLVLAIVLPVVLFSVVSFFCFWRWRVWKSNMEQKPDFSSRLMPAADHPLPASRNEDSQYTIAEAEPSLPVTSPNDERSPYGTLNTVGGKLRTEASVGSYPRYRIEFDEESEDVDWAASRMDETENQIQQQDISVTERPPLIFSNRFAPRVEEVQEQTMTDKARDNSGAFELYSYRADTEDLESSSDDEPLKNDGASGHTNGNKADWMC